MNNLILRLIGKLEESNLYAFQYHTQINPNNVATMLVEREFNNSNFSTDYDDEDYHFVECVSTLFEPSDAEIMSNNTNREFIIKFIEKIIELSITLADV